MILESSLRSTYLALPFFCVSLHKVKKLTINLRQDDGAAQAFGC